MKKFMGLTLIALLFCVMLLPTICAAPEEYLFPNETIKNLPIQIKISGLTYQLYEIGKLSGSEKLVIEKGVLAPDEYMKKALFAYNTHVYFINNEEIVKNYYRTTYNELDEKAESFSQLILNAFKLLKGYCTPVPLVEIVSVCVEPTKGSEIIDVGSKVIPDWSVALDNYRKLGGDVLYLLGDSGTIDYDNVITAYVSLSKAHSFLNIAYEKSKIQFEKPAMNPDIILKEVGTNTNSDFKKIKERLAALTETEKTEFSTANTKNEELRTIFKNIKKVWGDYIPLESRRIKLYNDLQTVKLNDQKFRSDITHIDNVIKDIDSLQADSKTTLDKATADFNSRGVLYKLWFGLWGEINSWFI